MQYLLEYRWIGNLSWMNELYEVLPSILYAILAVVGGAGMVYSIILGVNLAKSENDEKRRTAAYRLRNTLIGVAVLLVLVLIVNIGIPNALRAIYGEKGWADVDKMLDDAKTIIKPMMNIFTLN